MNNRLSSLLLRLFLRAALLIAFTASGLAQESRQFPLGPIGGYYSVSANSSLAVIRSVDAGGAGANAGLQAGDFIYGAFGQTFTPTGTDHYGVTQELGFAVDRAEAGNGTLPLMVMRPGTGALTINVALAAAGAFGPAYPRNSAKYAPMYETAVADLHTRAMNSNGDMGYLTGFTGLCLLGHPNWNDTTGAKPYRLSINKIRDVAKTKIANWGYAPTEDKLVDNSPIPNPSSGPSNWELGQLMMFLSEYYVKTSDSSVFATIQRGAEMCANTVQWWKQPSQSGPGGFQPEYAQVAGMSSHGGVQGDYMHAWYCGINAAGAHNLNGLAFARRVGANMDVRPKDGHYFGFNVNPGDPIPAGIANALPSSITLPQYAADPVRGLVIQNTSSPLNRSDASDPFFYNPSINQKYLMQMDMICRRSMSNGNVRYAPEVGDDADGVRTPGALLGMSMYQQDVGGLDSADLARVESMKQRISANYMAQQDSHVYCFMAGQTFQAFCTPLLSDRQQRFALDNWRFYYALSRTANNGIRYLSGRNGEDAGVYLDNNHCASINIALPYGIANGGYSLIPAYNTNRILANFKSPALTWPSIDARYAKVTNASQQAFQVDICDGMGAVLSASSYTASWTHVSGPATATFSNPSSANTTVTFPAPGRYRIQLAATSGSNSITEPIDVDVSFVGPPAGYTQGYANFQVFTGIGGPNVSDLTSSSKYINNTPDVAGTLTQLSSTYSGDNYGQRIQGYIVPQVTGSYRFYLSSDDASQFIFNSSGAAPTTSVAINLTNSVSKYTWTAQSAVYTLTAGQPYYFRVLHKEAGGGDHAAVAWTGPNISSPTIIPGYALATDSASSITGQPTNQTATLGSNATFSVAVTGAGPFVYQWRLNGVSYWAPSPSPSLNLTNVGSGAVGTYDCVITTPAGTLVSNSATLSINATLARITGGLRREVWNGIGGNAITALTGQQSFPLFPSITTSVSSAETPQDYGDDYGQKLSGWLKPPVTGNYKFFIASDDGSEVWLSSDVNPANKVKIAQAGVSGYRNYPNGGQSGLVNLVAGQKYYIEILHKEGGGGDYVSVAWQPPGEPAPAAGALPIDGVYLEYDQYLPLLTNQWKLDEASGTTCADSVGTATATLVNNPSHVAGLMGNAVSFNGVNQYAQATLDVSETVYGMSLWFRTSQASGGLFSAVNGDTNYDRCVYLSGGNLKAYVWQNETISTSGTNYADGQWHHVLHTFGGAVGGQKLYVDGVLAASGSKSNSDNPQQNSIRIGDAITSSPRYFNGQIDDVRVYNAALSSSDAVALYSSGTNAAPQMSPVTFSVAENASVGSTVGTLSATDASAGQTITYSISGGNFGGRFALNPSTGVLTVAAPLDYESNVTTVLSVTATDNGTPTQSVTTTATVNVTNVNEPPVFASSPVVGQPAVSGLAYSGTIAATEPESSTVTYAKISGPAWLSVASNGALAGTPTSGNIGINSFVIRATDATSLTADVTLQIDVVDVTVSPVWTNASGGSWPVSGNWLSGGVGNGSQATANFASLDLTSNATVTLDGPRTIGGLKFGDTTPSNDWTLNAGSGGTLTLAATSGSPVINVQNQTTTLNAVLSGTQGLYKTGSGTLVLGQANSLTGAVTISQGTVRMLNNTALGNGAITIGDSNTGAANVAWLFQGGGNPSNPITVTNLGTGTVTLGSHSGGFSSPASSLTLNRPVTLQDATGDRTSFSGKISGLVGTITLTGSRVTFDNATNNYVGDVLVSSGTIYQNNAAGAVPDGSSFTLLGSNSRFRLNSNSETIGGLNGSGIVDNVVGSGNTLSVGGGNASGAFSGALTNGSGTLNFAKIGTGTQILAGASTHTGTTAVNGGTLQVNGTLAAGSAVTVGSGATLSGAGTINGTVTLYSGATLAAGNAGIGTLSIANTLTLHDAGTIVARINKTGTTFSADRVAMTGASGIVFKGTLTVTLAQGSDALAAGDSFQLCSATS